MYDSVHRCGETARRTWGTVCTGVGKQLGEPKGFSWGIACTGAGKQMGEPVGFSWGIACTGAGKQLGEPKGFSWGTACTGTGKQMGEPKGFSWGTACTGAGKQLGEPKGFSWGTACTGAGKQLGEPTGFSWGTACTGAGKQLGEPTGFSWGTACTGAGKQLGEPTGFSWGTACTGAGKQMGEPEGFSWGMLTSKYKIVTWDGCWVRSGRTMRESELVSTYITHLNASSICRFDLKLNHRFLCWQTSHETKRTSFFNSLAVDHLFSNINENLLRVLVPWKGGLKALYNDNKDKNKLQVMRIYVQRMMMWMVTHQVHADIQTPAQALEMLLLLSVSLCIMYTPRHTSAEESWTNPWNAPTQDQSFMPNLSPFQDYPTPTPFTPYPKMITVPSHLVPTPKWTRSHPI